MEQLELCPAMKKAMGFGPTRARILLVWSYLVSNPGFRVWAQNWYLTSSAVLGGLWTRLWKSSGPDINGLNFYLPKAFFQFGALESGPKLGPDCVGTIVDSGRPRSVSSNPTGPKHAFISFPCWWNGLISKSDGTGSRSYSDLTIEGRLR